MSTAAGAVASLIAALGPAVAEESTVIGDDDRLEGGREGEKTDPP